jgi:hypothetical protein
MTGRKNDQRKTITKRRTAALPAGVKVVPAPKSAVRRALLSGRDIETSVGRRTTHVDPIRR